MVFAANPIGIGTGSGAATLAAGLGAMPEFIGIIVAASTITGVFFKLP